MMSLCNAVIGVQVIICSLFIFSDLSSQLEHFREHVVEKSDEIQQMAAQQKVSDTEHEHRLVDLQETCARLSEANAQLKVIINIFPSLSVFLNIPNWVMVFIPSFA